MVDDHWSRRLLHPAAMIHGPATDLPPVLLNLRQTLVLFGCDSFNSLAHQSEPGFWPIATVLRFLQS